MSRRLSVLPIIFSNQRRIQLALAYLGCFIGFFLLLVAVQSIVNFRHLQADADQMIGSQYMVINKRVGLFNTMSNTRSFFSPEEVKRIAGQRSIERLSPFVANTFEAVATLKFTGGGNQVQMATDLFLESVGDEFLDVPLDNWKWSSGEQSIPVIIPSNFINLYNFTYAPARGLPQLSKGTIKLFGFMISLRGNGREESFTGSIIGFSDRISSIIVPLNFMEYANAQYGRQDNKTEDNNVYRIIAEVKPNAIGEFKQFLDEHDYETNQELLKNGRLVGLAYLTVSVLFFIGVVVVLNSFTSFVLYFQLLIHRSRSDIDSLLRLGYAHRRLVMDYLYRIAVILFFLTGLSLLSLMAFQGYLSRFLGKYNFYLPSSIHTYSLVALLLALLLFIVSFYFQIRREVYNIALPHQKIK